VTQAQRLQVIGSVVVGIVIGLAVFFIGRAVKDHFAFNAAVCNTFNGTTAGCAGNEFAYQIGGIVQYLGIFLGIGGILAGLALSMAHNRTQPAAGTRLTAGQAPAAGAPNASKPMAAAPPQPRVSHPPAAGGPASQAPAGPGPSSAVPAAWISTAPAPSPALPGQPAEPAAPATDAGPA
jgi:hypothetical protein